jgi:protein SCO1/2
MKYLAAIVLCLFQFVAGASELTDGALRQIRFDQKIGARVPLATEFRDETGRPVRLGEYFGSKPVLLVLGYYRCPMLCTLVSNGLVESLHDLKANVGQEFDVLDVSISPTEGPKEAAAKKREDLRHYGREGAEGGWHLLTGEEPAIHQLASAVGFRYTYDPAIKQYAHPSGFIVLTSDGRVSRYFFGVDFRAQDLADALRAAADNHTGSPVRQLLLLCFHYSPFTGKYSALILNVVRTIGIASLLALALFISRSIRSDRRLRP